MNAKDKALRGEKVRMASLVVMDGAMLERARRKAAQHGVAFPDYLERAVRLYGKLLDKKVTVIARPI